MTKFNFGWVAVGLFVFSGIAQAATGVGKVVELKGHAWAKLGGQAERELHPGSELFQLDHLRTSPDGSTTLLLGGSIALLVKSNTEIDIDGAKDWNVGLDRGAVLSVVRNPLHKPHFFRIKTAAAVMGVRGTTFFVKNEPGKPVFFCPCHGEIVVESSDQASHLDFKSVHHDHPSLISDGPAAIAERAKPIPAGFDVDHSDAEAARLEQVIRQEGDSQGSG